MKKKLLSRRGETLVEVLVAVIIVALSAALLATMVAAATRISISANDAIYKIYEQLSAAESGSISTSGTVTVSYGGATTTVQVDYNRLDDDSLTAYVRR